MARTSCLCGVLCVKALTNSRTALLFWHFASGVEPDGQANQISLHGHEVLVEFKNQL